MERFDCQACGVCCCNTERNLEAGSSDYIEITRQDVLYVEHREQMKQMATRNEGGQWHFKIIGEDNRCVNLDGDLAIGVGCNIYPLRPAGCRNVTSGDEECLRARRAHGLPLSSIQDRERIERFDEEYD